MGRSFLPMVERVVPKRNHRNQWQTRTSELSGFNAGDTVSHFNTSSPASQATPTHHVAEMAHRVLAGAVAALMLASALGDCPLPTMEMTSTGNIVSATKFVIDSSVFSDDAAKATLLPTCATTERVDIMSVKMTEKSTPAKDITVNVVYKSAASQMVVKTLSTPSTTCYDDVSMGELMFGANAPTNPDKIVAAVEITCASATVISPCVVDYQVTAKCSARSPVCPALPASAITMIAPSALPLRLPVSTFVLAADHATSFTGCADPTQRFDLTHVQVTDTSGQNIKVNVGYEKDSTSQLFMSWLDSGTCFQSSGVDTMFGSRANANADKTTPVVEVTCLATMGSCALQYEVVGECVAKTPYPVMSDYVTVPKAVGATAGLFDFPMGQVVDSRGIIIGSCAPGTRLDIVSATFAEIYGSFITADVKYQSINMDSSKIKFVLVKTYTTDANSFMSSGTELSFANLADSHPDKVAPVITLGCRGTYIDCLITYNVVGKCVPISTKCTAIAPLAVAIPASGGSVMSINPMIKANTGDLTALTCTAGTQRLDITSVMIVETTGAAINVDVVYQQSPTVKSVVKTVTGVSCFDFGGDDVSFVSRAASNPAKITPLVTITCPSGTCNVQYDVLGKCVDLSPACPVITDTAVYVNPGDIKTFVRADFVATSGGIKLAADCATGRLDITSVKIVELTGANVDVSVKYRIPGVSNLLALPFKSVSNLACYTSTDTSYTKADLNPLLTDAIVDVKCLSTTLTPCSVKFDIVAVCTAKSTACSTASLLSGSDTIAAGQPKTIALTEFKNAATPTTALSSCTDTTKRLEITSLKVVETNGANIVINVGYQKDSAHQSVATTMSGVSCYTSAIDELRFTTANADANPFKVTPYVMIQCPATNAAACNVQYEVLAECVVASTKCASLTTTAQAITVGNIVEITPAKFVDTTTAKAALACTATQRADIQSVKVLEVNGNMINIVVKYQKDDASAITVKTVSNASCYDSSGAMEVSFSSLAAINLELANAVVAVECALTNAADCSVKYEVAGVCVERSSFCPQMPATSVNVASLAKGAKLALPLSSFKATDGVTVLASCVDNTKRLDMTSVKVLEMSGHVISVDVGYQKDAANQAVMASVASATCFEPSTTRFLAKIDANADKTDPFVEVTCLATAGNCVLKYEVLGECVTKTTCPVLPSTANSITVTKTMIATPVVPTTISLAKVVDSKGVAIPFCPANTRLDILSATLVEATGASFNANIKYQSVNTDLTKIKAVSVTGGASDTMCIQTGATELSFAPFADSHPDKVTPVITLTCPSTTADCNVNYKIVGKCVPVSIKCPTMTSTAVDVPTATPLSPMIKETAAATVALTCPTGRRVDLVSMKVVETTGANINVIVGYQQDDAKKSVIKSASSVDCFDFGAKDLSFAVRAPMNPGKVTPVVLIECSTETCMVQHEVIGKCTPVSTACPTITAAAATVPFNTMKPFILADFVVTAGGAALTTACTASQRLEISAVKIVETTGANIDINIKYRTTIANNLNPVTVKTLSGVACYTSTGTETTFSSQADGNPLHLDAVVEVKCLSTSVDCLVKYDIVAACKAKSTACTTPTAVAKSIATGSDWTTVALTEFKDAATPTSALSSCGTDGTKRLEIKSFKITETSGASVKVNFGYQKDATHQYLVKSVSGVSCYMSATDELRFTTANADANPFKVTPYVMIQCPATNAAACNVQYEVLAECVVASTKCASLTTTAQAITVGNIVEITPAKFVDTTTAKAALACTATQRADIQSVKVLEVNGNMINIVVKYQKNATKVSNIKNVTGVSCYESTGTTELSFVTKAADNYDYTNTIVAVECASSNAADCSVKYEIIANCIARSPVSTPAPTTVSTPAPSTTTKTTELAESGAAAMNYHTRAIAMVVSIAAGGFMMYRRH